MPSAAERIIIALDVPSSQQALELARTLKPHVGWFKIGLQLFTAGGPEIVRRILREGRVFLDLKLHDIPNTVGRAAVEVGRLGAHMVTLHALGGRAMLERARESVERAAGAEGWARPRLLAVTVLTSMDEAALASAGIRMSVKEAVVHLARSAQEAGMDGVVCSPLELPLLERAGLDLLRVTPGVRPAGAESHDQARTRTPGQALAEGADYLVIGRPVTRAPDPAAAVRAILDQLEA